MHLQKNLTSSIYFYILIRHWKSFEYFDRCIDSVINQSYKNYKILFVDDASGYDFFRIKYIKEKLRNHIAVFNKIQKFSVRNGYELIHKYCPDNNAVVINLDGDDWFIDNYVLNYFNQYYTQHPKCLLTYGTCKDWDGRKLSQPDMLKKGLINIPYPKKVMKEKNYRKYPFLITHPRTWKVYLSKKINKKYFLKPNGTWLRFAEDHAFYLAMLEMANGNYGVIHKALYVYNFETSLSDKKINHDSLAGDIKIIRNMKPHPTLKYV